MRAALLLLLLALPGCRRPVSGPPAVAQVLVSFRDRDVLVPLPAAPPPGPWQIMDLGLWSPLAVAFDRDPRLGLARQDRVAPDSVLLRAPDGTLHRKDLRPLQEPTDPEDRLAPEDRDFLTVMGLVWVLGWWRR
jgi:hypothetical protein